MMKQLEAEPVVLTAHNKARSRYGSVMYVIGFTSCMIALIAPVLILAFPQANILNPNLVFGAIFSGLNPSEIWATAGIEFKQGSFWPLLKNNLFTPDGFAMFGIALGCSSALWAFCPTAWSYIKGKKWFFLILAVFIQFLIALAMTGLVNLAD